MTKNEMMQIVYQQLAVDYNCNPEDFLSDEIVFTVAKQNKGRRAVPFIEPRLEIVTFGRGLVVNCSSNIMDYVKKQFQNKSKFQIINSSLIKSFNPYYLPDLDNFKNLTNINDEYEYRIIEKNEIRDFYHIEGMHNALQYDSNSERPEILGITVYKDNILAGIACASKDCSTMWQIGVDVLPEYRGQGLAVHLVNVLSSECLKRNIIPYYTTDIGNINSQKVAIKSGFYPAWSHCFRTRVKKNPFTKSILSII